jgi:predicted DNA binding CopG/RHH family protein
MKPKKIIDSLDEYEQDLEDNFEKLINYTPEEEKIKIAELVKAAKVHNAERTRLSLDVSTSELMVIKHKASKRGMSYQAYINLIIHENAASA